jgi:hypothetical protein
MVISHGRNSASGKQKIETPKQIRYIPHVFHNMAHLQCKDRLRIDISYDWG